MSDKIAKLESHLSNFKTLLEKAHNDKNNFAVAVLNRKISDLTVIISILRKQ